MCTDEQDTTSTEATVEFTYRVSIVGPQIYRFVRVEIFRGEELVKYDFTRRHPTEAELDEHLVSTGASHVHNDPIRTTFLPVMFIYLPERAMKEIIVIAKELNKQHTEELAKYPEVMREATTEFDIVDNVPISEVDVVDYEEDK